MEPVIRCSYRAELDVEIQKVRSPRCLSGDRTFFDYSLANYRSYSFGRL